MRHPSVQFGTRKSEDYPDLPFLHQHEGCGESQLENDRQDSTLMKNDREMFDKFRRCII